MMTLSDMKKKVLSLIEEIDEKNPALTGDPDIAEKLNYVINQVQYELSRVKKIPDYIELEVQEKDIVKFEDIKAVAGYDVYQLDIARGLEYEYKCQGKMIKCLEAGTLEIEYFRYPKRIDKKTPDTYEFELSDDVLEVMPYGVAADLTKTDPSTNYGQIFAVRYENMKNQLDVRYNTGSIRIEGGINV